MYYCRRFFKDMPQVALDKKSNFEYLEKEIGFKRFLPKSVIDSMKVRTFRFILGISCLSGKRVKMKGLCVEKRDKY